MWSLNKKVLYLLVISYLASTASASVILARVLLIATGVEYVEPFTRVPQLMNNLEGVFPIPNGSYCVLLNVPTTRYTFWIPMLAFETLLCLLATVRAIQTFMDGTFFRSVNKLFYILVRDSALYYIV